MKKIFLIITALLVPALFLSGCSAIMAASSSENKDLGVLKYGTRRFDVERELGKPIKFDRTARGDVATYQYFSGDEANYKRAAAYTVLTGVTLGMSEFFTAPVEALQGDRNEVKVLYDRTGRVKSYKHIIHKAPIPPAEKILGIENATQ